MPVDPFLPESTYKGADRQEWVRERRRLNPPPSPPRQPRAVPNIPVPHVLPSTVPTVQGISRPAPRPSQPFLPGVDKWVQTIPKQVFWTLALVGAICGLGFGLSTGDVTTGFWYALLGGLAGLSLINLLAKAFKLFVGVLLIAAVGLVIYALFHASAGH